MVDDEYYDKKKNNKDDKIKEEKKYPKAFVVYRLAIGKKIDFSAKEYQEYNIVI